jgi:hypothetical protein
MKSWRRQKPVIYPIGAKVSDLSNLKEDTNIVIDDFHVFTAETL